MSARDTLDPAQSYLYLADGGAVERLDLDDGFWEDLASGRLDLDRGRLLMAADMTSHGTLGDASRRRGNPGPFVGRL